MNENIKNVKWFKSYIVWSGRFGKPFAYQLAIKCIEITHSVLLEQGEFNMSILG